MKSPVVIAHRGASGYLPEHCLAGKAMAHALGADFLEQDIVASRDGVPIVFHDLTLDALTNVADRFPDRARDDGGHYCIDFDFSEIAGLELRERRQPGPWRARYPGRFPPDAAAFRIPSLAQELSFIRGLNRSTGREAGIYPEIKAPAWHREQGIDLSAAVIRDLRLAGYLEPGEPVFLQCFDAGELERLRAELGPGLPMIQLLSGDPDEPGLEQIATYAQGIGPSLQALVNFSEPGRPSTGLREAATKSGLLVHPWTARADDLPDGISDFDQLMEICFADLQLDGLFSDFPDRVKAWLDQHAG